MRNATLTLAVLAAVALAPRATAQCTGTPGTDFEQVTVREIHAIPQANIDQLNAASAADTLEIIDAQALLATEYEGDPLVNNDGELVEFQAVLLSDPLLSGLATATNGIPGRIHVFVRDVNALNDGPTGMDIQIVDGRGDGAIQQFFKGDEVVVCGFVNTFGNSGGKSMQIAPVSITAASTPVVDLNANPTFDDPITVSIDDFHDAVGNNQTQIDWDVYSDFNGQYVRIENATLVQGVQGTRPNLLLSSAANGDAPQLNVYDTSVCYRNDRDATYFPANQAPACIDDDFVPPATGTVNIQGFLIFQGDTGGFNYSLPNGANFVINPMEESDFEVTAAPPIVTPQPLASIPGPTANVTITATVVAGQGTITSVVADYRYVVNGTAVQNGQITLSSTTGSEFSGTIPARTEADANGAFVIYTITAMDSGGGTTTSPEQSYLVFEGAIDSIARIQTTADGEPGDSPLATGTAASFDLDAVVQSVFQTGSSGNWVATIQDDESLAPFTGVWIFFGSADPGLTPGDRINITEATVGENFGVTQLTSVTFTTTGSGTPFGYKEVSTSVFNGSEGAATAEQHEGMLVSFDNVTVIATNADAPAGPFGEFLVSSDGTASNAVRVDDYSNGISYAGNDPDELVDVGTVLDYVRGPLYFSFGNYKVTPVTTDDIGPVNTAAEGDIQALSIRIVDTRPNPVRSTARVGFELDVPGPATLRLFDMTGRQVQTVVSGEFAAQAHTAELDVRGLASGVYILRLEAAGEVATTRIAVVR